MSNRCPKCGSGNFFLLAVFRNNLRDKYHCYDCGFDFVYPPFTLFDRITASPAVLAEKLVFITVTAWGETVYMSTIIRDGMFKTREEAIAATVEKLKEAVK